MHALEMRSMLVVEDDEDQLELLTDGLAHLGIEIIGSPNADKALELLKQRSFDAVMTDYNMPGKTGIDLLIEMKGMGLDIPVVMLTGILDTDITIHALRLGAVDFIHKPAGLNEIIETAERVIEIGVRRRRLCRSYNEALTRLGDDSLSKTKTEIERQSRMISLLQLKNRAKRF